MEIKDKLTVKIMKTAFGIVVLTIISLFLLGQMFGPEENPTGNAECVVLDAEWERVFPDGTRSSIEIPGQCKAQWGEVVRLETVLPQNQQDIWFCMRASQQDMKIYVGDELRTEYSTKETRIFGRNSVSAFVFFEIKEEDAGKVLAIEQVSYSEYTGFLNQLYTGEKFDIARMLVNECAAVILVSVYMLIVSTIAVFVGAILRYVYKKKVDITYLGLGLLLVSLSMIFESRIRQFFLPNASMAADVGFLLTILMPYPFMVYVNRVQKGRYEKYYRVLSLVVSANFVISVLLQICNVLHLADTMYISYIILFVMIVLMAVTCGLDIRKGRVREYGEVIHGIIVMLVVSVWEICINCVPILPYHGGVALSFGLIILLFAAGIKTAREMLAIEQEKQIAIASGQAKTKFLANMSHEIRTPINTIIGMNEMILRENQNEDIERYAKNVQNASELLLGLINDILDFSKIEAGKVNILETEYHLSTLLTDVLKGIQIKADSKKLDVCVHVEETLPSVLEGDEIRIRQILNNLLSNAVKYTHEGRVTLTVKGLREKEKFTLCMEVEDTGIGIKPEDTEKLFESFHRLEENKNRYIEGTGLGLNICRQLVELMGGDIEVRSEYGKGSCFIVKIPQKIKDETMIGKLEEAYQRDISAKEESKQRLYAPTAEILVVDDNEMNLAVVKELLRRTAVKLTLVQSGAECLEICRKNKFDLILMDHMMPEPDGIETLHMLREDAANLNRDTHVIVLTANAIAGMAEMYLEEGFSDYLSKPVNPDILENVIRRHLPEQKLEEVPEVKKETKALSVPEESPQKENAGILCIDKTLGLEYCRNNEEMYREMVKMYCMQGEKHHQSLSDYYAAKDWKNYKITVHAVKSTSLMIGAKAFSEKAGRLEAAASEADEEILLKETELFLTEYREMLEILGR